MPNWDQLGSISEIHNYRLCNAKSLKDSEILSSPQPSKKSSSSSDVPIHHMKV